MTLLIQVLGMVQGIGFRPFVARLAESLHLTGYVCNSGGIVEITVQGDNRAVNEFIHRLKLHPPSGSQITEILTKKVERDPFSTFQIIESHNDHNTQIPPILPVYLPVCEECLNEMQQPQNRRYRYPFISCTACGPRYTIMESLPYDRETTVMNDFPLCPSCQEEYTGSGRRRHAQTISCHECGPYLLLKLSDATFTRESALQKACSLLKAGKILAVKGIGGYQFICSPFLERAVLNLRRLKGREKKPFAIMFPNLLALKKVCSVSDTEEEILCGVQHPIVLLPKREDPFCTQVCGESRFLGAFLPYTPLHALLTESCGPLIATSGNLAGEPIIIRDEEMLTLSISELAGVLYHQRRITTPLDDSVVRIFSGTVQMIRRARGYVPSPLFLKEKALLPILSAGGDLKSSFCLLKGDRAYMSQYFGDLESYGVAKNYVKNIERMCSLFQIKPQAIACDLHPSYLSRRLVQQAIPFQNLPIFFIQHHHAHIASVMAEHSLDSCIGVAFDGTGYGTDKTIWGGEFLFCHDAQFERSGFLEPIAICGGDLSAKDADLTALCHLSAAKIPSCDPRFSVVQAAIKQNIQSMLSSSIGRFFDAVCAILGIRKFNSYEGECAIALENCASHALQHGVFPYPLSFPILSTEHGFLLQRNLAIQELYCAKESGISVEALALGFHLSLSVAVCELCKKIRKKTGENRVALSGGVFMNLILSRACERLLVQNGFSVFFNHAVPMNDGGICLGQAFIALKKIYHKDFS